MSDETRNYELLNRRVMIPMKRNLAAAIAVVFLLCVTAIQADDSVRAAGVKPKLVLSEGAGEGPAWHPKQGLFSP